jgi:AcrR family transcriptional regulator
MVPLGASVLTPRKRPVQARSTVTLGAIHEAGIQVLLAVGFGGFTTSRVAERAGVSVGTLYQYYPNKRSLLASLLSEHLGMVVDAVEAASVAQHGAPLAVMTDAVVDAFLAAKLRRPEVSRALHAPMAEADGSAIVRAAAQRGAVVLGNMLASCADARIPQPHLAAGMVSTTLAALMQAALDAGAEAVDAAALRVHMRAMALGYLRMLAAGEPLNPPRSPPAASPAPATPPPPPPEPPPFPPERR